LFDDISLRIIVPSTLVIYGDFLSLDTENDSTKPLSILNSEEIGANDKMIEFASLGYNKLNEILSKIRYKNKIKLDSSEKFELRFQVWNGKKGTKTTPRK
jgi:hypothetical protein